MIVLMATGNTPVMDWSLFNGMRTLSANIAVEIPEAPDGGTGLLFAPTEQGISWALERAIILHRNPEKLRAAIGRGMRREFGWATAARRYEQLYNDEI